MPWKHSLIDLTVEFTILKTSQTLFTIVYFE